MKRIIEFFKKNEAEIANDRVLQIYGAMLAAIHVLTWIYWNYQTDLVGILTDGNVFPICWGFLEGCGQFRPFSSWLAEALNTSYLLLSVIVIGSFVWFRNRISYPLLIVINLFKIFLYLQDYRSMGNYHYMPFIVTMIYLFLPKKREVLQVMIVSQLEPANRRQR